MPGKHKFTVKQDRQAAHVASSMKKKGVSSKKAKSIGYATVNKQKSKGKKKFNAGAYAAAKKKHFGIA